MPDLDRIQRARDVLARVHLRNLRAAHGQWLGFHYWAMIAHRAQTSGRRFYILRAP